MKKRFDVASGFLCAGLAVISTYSQDDRPAPDITLHGTGSFEAGQVMSGYCRGEDGLSMKVVKIWQQRVYLNAGFDTRIGERARIELGAECRTTFSWETQQEFLETVQPAYIFYPDRVAGSYDFGDVESPLLKVKVGYFPFKYNPDVRNLGEFLYRTGTYPGYIINEFDYPRTRLLGLHLSNSLLGFLRQDLLLTSEAQVAPLQDYGVTYLADVTIGEGLLNFGAGAFFSHLFSVRERYTTPRRPNNIADTTHRSVAIRPDSIVTVIDTTFYTFRGTKLMGRMAFDPKPLLGDFAGMLGPNDLRLYSEIAVIGLKDYPKYYNELWRRVPLMVGFNLPAFKVLDVLALEYEYYRNRYPNNPIRVMTTQNLPLPIAYDGTMTAELTVDQPGGNDVNYNKDDDQKWSVYASRRVAGCFTLIAQAANDHMRILRHGLKIKDYEESLRKPWNWHYRFKVAYGF
jgi:hypothetical protein